MKASSFLLLLMFVSCSPLYRVVGGIKNPRLESYASLNRYARTIGIDTADLVFAKDTAAISRLHQLFAGAPEILIFDHTKQHHPYKEEGVACNAPIDQVLSNICNADPPAGTGRDVRYDELLRALDDHNKCLQSFEPSHADFIVFIDYLKYLHGINKSHIVPWTKIIYSGKKSCRVKYVFVDFDYLDNWGLSKKDLPKLKLKT